MLDYKKFFVSKQLLPKYLGCFKQARQQNRVLEKTPQTKDEVLAWLYETASSPVIDYYFVYNKRKIIGHAGLREINRRYATANIGIFLFKSAKNCNFYLSILDFCLKLAQEKYNLKTVFAGVFTEDESLKMALLKKGFEMGASGKNWFKDFGA